MVATIGTSTNLNNEANILSAISVGSSTSVVLIPAQSIPGEPPRIKVTIYNDGPQGLWVKSQPASDDNDKKGFFIEGGEKETFLEGSDIYTGEISAIMDSGGARNVFVTWF